MGKRKGNNRNAVRSNNPQSNNPQSNNPQSSRAGQTHTTTPTPLVEEEPTEAREEFPSASSHAVEQESVRETEAPSVVQITPTQPIASADATLPITLPETSAITQSQATPEFDAPDVNDPSNVPFPSSIEPSPIFQSPLSSPFGSLEKQFYDPVSLSMASVGEKTLGTETHGIEALGTETHGIEALGTETIGTNKIETETLGIEMLKAEHGLNNAQSECLFKGISDAEKGRQQMASRERLLLPPTTIKPKETPECRVHENPDNDDDDFVHVGSSSDSQSQCTTVSTTHLEGLKPAADSMQLNDITPDSYNNNSIQGCSPEVYLQPLIDRESSQSTKASLLAYPLTTESAIGSYQSPAASLFVSPWNQRATNAVTHTSGVYPQPCETAACLDHPVRSNQQAHLTPSVPLISPQSHQFDVESSGTRLAIEDYTVGYAMSPTSDLCYGTPWLAHRTRLWFGRLSSGPHSWVLILTFALIVIPALVFSALVLPRLKNVVGSPVFVCTATAFAVSLFCSCYFHLRCAFTDPGVIPRLACRDPTQEMHDTYVEISGRAVESKWCSTCSFYRPVRASHCRVCDVCVDRFDHHCPWVDNCIGVRNSRWFFYFIVATTSLSGIVFASTFWVLWREMRSRDGTNIVLHVVESHLVWTFLAVYALVSFIPLIFFSAFHTYLICVNKTAREWSKGTFPDANPFDHGLQQNIKDLLCSPIPPSRIYVSFPETDNARSLREHVG